MRLLILTQYYPPEIGAPQTRLAAFAKALTARGVDVEVVTAMPHHLVGRVFPTHRGKLFAREEWDGIPVRRTWVYAATGTGIRRLFNYGSFTFTSFFGMIGARRPDIVFVESPPLFLALRATLSARLHGAAMIFNVADLWPDAIRQLGMFPEGHPVLRVAEALEAFAYWASKFVTTVTDGMVEVLTTKKRVPAHKVLFLPNGVDLQLFRPAPPSDDVRRELDVRADDALYVYAGTHGVAQGLETLVQAAALVRDEGIVVALIGDGHTKAAMRELAGRLNATNVRFVATQPLTRMPAYFSTATASIVPLIRNDFAKEARPSKMFPSLACGVPIIFSGDGESAHLVRDNDVGLVVPPESPAELAAAMRAMREAAVRRRLSVNARRLAENRFDWNRIVEDWLSELRRRTAEA
ncbi:MAG: glycosyltransferase family 4 protein [Candidatus Velthaea sp.]